MYWKIYNPHLLLKTSNKINTTNNKKGIKNTLIFKDLHQFKSKTHRVSKNVRINQERSDRWDLCSKNH